MYALKKINSVADFNFAIFCKSEYSSVVDPKLNIKDPDQTF
jgi:hypothetical protein